MLQIIPQINCGDMLFIVVQFTWLLNKEKEDVLS